MPILINSSHGEGGPPVEEADRLAFTLPVMFSKLVGQRITAIIRDKDKLLLDGLVEKGYKLNFGEHDSGIVYLCLKRGGGYYVGTFILNSSATWTYSQYILT